MNRKEFLSKLGVGAAFALTATCLGGCAKENFAPTTPVDFTLDLDSANNNSLKNNGGYMIQNRVVVAKDNNGNYVAATQTCSHEGTNAIILKDNEWFCTDHDARFDLNGNGLNKDGEKGLTIYKTELSGDMLRVYS